MEEYKDEIELMDILNVIWKKKWLIILPTLLCVIAAGIISFSLPKVWEIDAIIQPSKFFVQTEQGRFEEIYVVEPKQIAGQVNQASYNQLIAAELNLDIRDFPKLSAENLRDTKLVRVSLKEQDVEKAKLILTSIFNHLKRDLDKKIDVEIKGIDTKIITNENAIKEKEIDIRAKEIDKAKITQQINSAENKLKISQERVISIMEEMKTVKSRTEEIEKQQKSILAEKKEGTEALSLLLYANEVQNNMRYYNTLDEKLSTEKITQENLSLFIKEIKQEIKQLNIQIEKLKSEIIEINNQIELLKEKKIRIDYAQLVKEPTSSTYPVSPRKKLNVLIAGILGLMLFTFLAFFLEYIEKNKAKT
ncbi:MAG: hypothetical protein IBX60_09270 [Candidatus Aminicenantes bacterium]|nr:hypothetical protein [Candidatus Aminicenantes bacterium]